MPSGVQQQLGIGQAQVLPPSESNPMRVVELYQQNKDRKVNQQRYDDRQKEQSEKELYGILGDALNPRNFNQAIHGKILQAQRDLAQKIKSGTPSYGDTYIMAQNKAAELGSLSQQLNNADQQIALTKKEYEFDKRINSGAIEMAARKRILDELNRTGKIDETINYYDEAANDNPDIALIDKSGYTFTDFRPEEKQPLEFDIKKRSAVGKTNQYKWKMDNYPAYYDVIQKGDYEAPEVKTRSEMIKDAKGNDIPALSEEAYRRFSLTPSNVFAINQRLKSRYGDKLNLRSEQAETLRRIEAFKDVERNKPVPKESIVEQQPIPRIYNTTNVNTGSGSNVNDVVGRMKSTIQEDVANGFNVTRFNKLKGDEQTLIKDFVNKDLSQDDKYKGDDIFVSLNGNDEIEVYKKSALEEGKNPNTLITTLPGNLANLKAKQAGAKENRAIVAEGNKDNPKPSGKTPKYKGLDKNGNPIFE